MKLYIEKLDYEGKGITHIDNKICFVPRTLPSETVEVTLKKEAKHFIIGEKREIITPSLKRKDSFCPYASKCGGCVFDFVTYEDSLIFKKEVVKELLTRNNIQIPTFEIEPSVPNLGYRNKISLKVLNGKFGFYQEESHQLVEIENCFLAKKSIHEFLENFSLLGVKEGNVTIRSNDNEELLIIIESEKCPKIKEALAIKHKIAGIIWNHKCIYNSPFFIEKRENLLYKVHADAFFQVNSCISEKIALDVLRFYEATDEVFDLYCGVGYFSLKLAQKVKKVIGIEVNQNAILDALYNANLNHLPNTSFHVGKVEEIIDEIPNNVTKVLVDPPRSGLYKTVIETILKKNFSLITYISCNPKTLVRDIGFLKEKYEISYFKAYDMFPYTKHVECVCVLKLKTTTPPTTVN